ncbi:MAG: hypothetical protein IPP74_09530 [Alphaproteobacteria bacterium]|nr:hypothetical protein [Alphaproteobacteria bacterium]
MRAIALRYPFLTCICVAAILHGIILVRIPVLLAIQHPPKIPSIISFNLNANGNQIWHRMQDQDDDYIDPAGVGELNTMPVAMQKKNGEVVKKWVRKIPPSPAVPFRADIPSNTLEVVPMARKAYVSSAPTEHVLGDKPVFQSGASSKSNGNTDGDRELANLKGRYTAQLSILYNQNQVLPKGFGTQHTGVPQDPSKMVSVNVIVHVDKNGNILRYFFPYPVRDSAIRDAALATLEQVKQAAPPPQELFTANPNQTFIAFTFNLIYW